MPVYASSGSMATSERTPIELTRSVHGSYYPAQPGKPMLPFTGSACPTLACTVFAIRSPNARSARNQFVRQDYGSSPANLWVKRH